MKRIAHRLRTRWVQASVRAWVQAWIVVVLAAVVVGFDQWSKHMVRATLAKSENVPVLGKWLMWQHVDNYGAAFGIAQDTSWLIVVVTAVAVVITGIVLWFVQGIPSERRLIRVLFGLQLGGAVGNLVDRYLQGYVTDFIKIGIPNVYYWHVWNIADAAIVVGTLGLIVYMVWTDIVVPRRVPNQMAGSDAEAEWHVE